MAEGTLGRGCAYLPFKRLCKEVAEEEPDDVRVRDELGGGMEKSC